jgi:hypothetical protein
MGSIRNVNQGSTPGTSQASISEKSSDFGRKDNLSLDNGEDIYDPDAGKSDEERAAIVSPASIPSHSLASPSQPHLLIVPC